jgi:hypothetical protein
MNSTPSYNPDMNSNMNSTPSYNPDMNSNMNSTPSYNPDINSNMNSTPSYNPDINSNMNPTPSYNPDINSNMNSNVNSTQHPNVNSTPSYNPNVGSTQNSNMNSNVNSTQNPNIGSTQNPNVGSTQNPNIDSTQNLNIDSTPTKQTSLYNSDINDIYMNLNILKNQSEYEYNFNKIDNIKSIKLINYSLPDAIYNIYDSDIMYEFTDNKVIIDKIHVPLGYYKIDNLLEILNNNIHLEFILNNQYRIAVKLKKTIIDKNDSLTTIKTFKFYESDFLKKLGLYSFEDTSYCQFTNPPDLRLPTNLKLKLINLNTETTLFFNKNDSNFGINFKNTIILDNIIFQFIDNNGNLYDFNEIDYELFFELKITP